MKVLLVNPSQSAPYGRLATPSYQPLGLAYVGAVLEQGGHQVGIIDMDVDRISRNGLAEHIRRDRPELVGITAMTPSFNAAVSLAGLAKDAGAGRTVLGGVHPTLLPEESIASRSVDFVIKGEGEETILQLVGYLEKSGDLREVDGLVFKEGGRVVANKDREFVRDLDRFPFPARHLFRVHKYTYPDTRYALAFPIITSRGCPGSCTYCAAKSLFKRRLRLRGAVNVVDEIELLVKKYQAREIHIWDDNFITRPDRIFEIRDEIKKRKLEVKFAFPNGLRVDYITREILEVLKDMGVYSIAYGVESGEQRILDRVNKGINIEQIKEAFRLTREMGFETWGFFMLGLPDEDGQTISRTVNLARKLNPDIAKFHILQPYPRTEDFDEFSKKGYITDFNYDHYGIHSSPIFDLPGLSRNDLLSWQKKAYRDFYLRPGKIINQLLRIKTLHRLNLNFRTGLWVLKKIFTQ